MRGRLVYLSGAPRASTDPRAEEGGARSHMLGVLQGFRELGWASEALILGDHLPASWRRRGSGRRFTRSRGRLVVADLVRLGLGLAATLVLALRWRGRADLVYERGSLFQALGWVLRAPGVPWVLECNDLLAESARRDRRALALAGLARRIEGFAYRRCDLVVAVTPALRDQLVAHFGLDPEKVLVLPNGVDVDFFDPDRVPAPPRRDALVVGFLGRFYAWQAVPELLRAVAALAEELPELRLELVGGGPEEAAWRAEAERLGLGERVRFRGELPRDQVPAALARFDAGFLGQAPGWGGVVTHSPLKAYEYLAMGKPVLASRFPEAEALLGEDGAGFLYEHGDQASLVAALRALAAARSELPSRGARGRARVLARHRWRHRVEALLRQLARRRLGGADPPPPGAH